MNAIWPRTAIMTAAMEMLGGGKGIRDQCRNTDIMADAAYVILTRDSRTFTGNSYSYARYQILLILFDKYAIIKVKGLFHKMHLNLI